MYKGGPAPYRGVWTELSDKEERSKITEEQIIQLFGNIELQPAIREDKNKSLVDEQGIQETKDDMSSGKRDMTDLSGKQKSRVSFNSIKQAIKKVLGRGER